MAEVLGIVAAVIGVADVSCKVSVLLYKYINAVAYPNEVLKSIQPEVLLISSVTQQLGVCLQDDKNVDMCKPETLQTTKNVVIECKKTLKETEELILDFFDNKTISLLDRLRRYNVEKKINLLRANLDRLKSTLILMLEVIKYARSILKHENKHKERDGEILAALKKANDDAQIKYDRLLNANDRLLNAIQYHGSSSEDQFSKLEISSTNTAVSEGSDQQYEVVDKNGMIVSRQSLSGDMALKVENISRLIHDVEQTHMDIKLVTDHSDIWERFIGNGDVHFRHTVITRHPQMPGIEMVPQHITRERSFGTTWGGVDGIRESATGIRAGMAEIYIALMGAVGAGKSTFVNVCCGENLAQISQGPGHCTESIEEYHFMYTPEIRVHLVDTPGFDNAHRSEREILTDLVEWMSQTHGELARLSGIIYLHKISDLQMHSTAHRNLRVFEKLCGADSIHSIILATTNWAFLGDLESAALLHEQELQTQDEYWGLMSQRGSRVMRHTGDHDSAIGILGNFESLSAACPTFYDFSDQMEPVERKRGFSDASIEFQSTEQQVNQLLAEYTTVLDIPHTQQRRWTMETTY